MANKPLQSLKFPGLPDTYTVPQVDSSLSVSGKAADAKKVGDELADVKQDLLSTDTLANIYLPDTVLSTDATMVSYELNLPENANAGLTITNGSASDSYFGYGLYKNNVLVWGIGDVADSSLLYVKAGKSVSFYIPSNISADTLKIKNRNGRSNCTVSVISSIRINTINDLLNGNISYNHTEVKRTFPLFSSARIYRFANAVLYKTKLSEIEQVATLGGAYGVLIPLKGVKSIQYPVFKTTSNCGCAMFDANDTLVWYYCEETLDTGTLKTVEIPECADYFLLSITEGLSYLDWNVTLTYDSLNTLRDAQFRQTIKNERYDTYIDGIIRIYPYMGAGEGLNGASVNASYTTVTVPTGSTGYNSYIQKLVKFPKYLAGKAIKVIFLLESANYHVDGTDLFIFNPSGVLVPSQKEVTYIGNNRYLAIISAVLPETLTSYYGITFQVKKTYSKSVETVISIVDCAVISADYTERITNGLYGESVIEVGTGKDYTSLRTALEQAKRTASKYNHVVVKYYSDGNTYDVMDDITADDLTSGSTYRGLTVPAYVKLVGMNRYSENVISLVMDTSISSTIRNRFSTINLDENGEVENLTFIGQNCRYACHDDVSSYNPEWKEKTIKNCRFISNNTIQTRAYGAGYRSGQHWKFENCIFELTGSELSTGYSAFSAHNNNAFTEPSILEFNNCQFVGGTNAVAFGSLNSGDSEVINTIKMVGCKLTCTGKAVLMFDETDTRSGCETAITGYANNFGASDVTFRTNDSVDYSDRVTVWGKISE